MDDGYHVYAIHGGETMLPQGITGLSGKALATVEWRALGAAVSPIVGGGRQPTVQDVLQHEAVVEAVRRCGPALPVRFGTVFADAVAVQRALAEHYDVLASDLARLGDKVELGLLALSDEPEMQRPIGELDADPLCSRLMAGGPGSQYFGQRWAEWQRSEFGKSRAKALASEIEEAVKPWTEESKLLLLPTPRLLLRAAYLVDPASLGPFREAVEAIRQRAPLANLLLSGPWPPYSFVKLGDGAMTNSMLVPLLPSAS